MNRKSKKSRNQQRRLGIEVLEHRQLLAADVIINEFVASNSSTLDDGFGESSDWIEIYNRGDQQADLSGYHLTDEFSDLSKWTFPDNTFLDSGEYMIVFASGRELMGVDPGGYLHADFKLSAGGEYLALSDNTALQPVVLSEFGDNGQDYPDQQTDISYGLLNDAVTDLLIGPEYPVSFHVPTTGVLGQTWTGAAANEPFDDSQWETGNFGVGYDTSPTTLTVGNEVVNRDSVDGAEGSIFALSSSLFLSEGTLTQWSMFSQTDGRQITPLILQRGADGQFTIVGTGTTRISDGSGEQVFDFQLQSGTDTVDETYFFGWKDGGNGVDNSGVADFTNGANEGVHWFGQRTNFSVNDNLGQGQSFSRAYSFQAIVESTLFGSEINAPVPDNTTTAYIRSKFNIDSSDSYESLSLKLKYDDGVVVYLNGAPVFDNLAPVNPTHASTATMARDENATIEFQVVNISEHRDKLRDGENILAIQVLNSSAGSSDLLAVAELEGVRVLSSPGNERIGYMTIPTPGELNTSGVQGLVEDTTFSIDRGFYTSAFDVDVTSETEGATLVYTTDGSVPTLSNGVQVFAGDGLAPIATVTIATTTTLRAAAYKPDFEPTNVDTQTYVFIDHVKTELLGRVVDESGQEWGLEGNGEEEEWRALLDESLLSVPTISITTEANLTGPSGSMNRLIEESPASIEYLLPDGTGGFQIDAGVEHFGGHSSRSPKRNIRVSFRSIYGASKLDYDLFEDPSAVTRFDQILLRAGSHDTWFWTNYGAANKPATGQSGVYFRNQWAYERQLELGHIAPHGRFVQVYINGEYFGMHNLMERPNSDFLESYLGGDDEDYDALNAGSPIDGDRVAWEAMVSAAENGDWSALQQYMDVENYIDYMLLEFYGGNNWDWNPSQNWAAGSARSGGDGYKFFAWDGDLRLRTSPTANVVLRNGPENLFADVLQIPEFQLQFADRVNKHFFNDGVLTDGQVTEQIEALIARTRLPVIAETARWGENTPSSNADVSLNHGDYTPDDWQRYADWIPDTFIPGRTATVVGQIYSRLPDVESAIDLAAYFKVAGVAQHGGEVGNGEQLSIETSSGDVYYTLDGSDPRAANGQPAGTLFQSDIMISNLVTVKARVLNNGEWSALTEAVFIPGQPASADFDDDNDIDGSDFLAWQRGFGKIGNAEPSEGDADSDQNVTASDLAVWSQQYGTITSSPSSGIALQAGASLSEVSTQVFRSEPSNQSSAPSFALTSLSYDNGQSNSFVRKFNLTERAFDSLSADGPSYLNLSSVDSSHKAPADIAFDELYADQSLQSEEESFDRLDLQPLDIGSEFELL